MPPAQKIKMKCAVEKLADKRVQLQLTPEHNSTEPIDRRKCRQTIAAQIAKGSLRNNGNNAKDNVDLRRLSRSLVYIQPKNLERI